MAKSEPTGNIVHFTQTFHFSQPPFTISAPTPPNFGGFTSLERDASLHGKIKIAKLTITFDATSKSNVGFGDVWAFLGPQEFTGKQSQRLFPVGPATWSNIVTYPWDLVTDDAPSQVKLACGRPGDMPSKARFSIVFDFMHKPVSEPRLDCTVKSSINDEMYLENGLYSQLFLWTGFPSADIEIDKIQMDVEGIFLDGGS
jgi:hypothetical protein